MVSEITGRGQGRVYIFGNIYLHLKAESEGKGQDLSVKVFWFPFVVRIVLANRVEGACR